MKQSRLQIWVFVGALSLGTISVVCLKAPQAPSWDTTITLPLLEKTYRLMDILPRNYFSVGDDSVIQFSASASTDTIRPIDAVTVSGQPLQTVFKLSDLALSGDYSARVKLGLQDILGIPLPEEPSRMPIPPAQFSLDRSFAVPEIHDAQVLRGAAIVSVGNFSNVTIDSATLVSELLGANRFTRIGPNSSPQNRRRLGGCQIAPENQFTFSGAVTGSGPDSVLVSCHDSIVVAVRFDSLRLSSADAQIPRAEAQRKLLLGVTTNHPFALDSVQFARGHADITFTNGFGFPLDVALRITRLGYFANLHLEPAASQTATIDLAGRSLASNSLTNSLVEVQTTVSVSPGKDYVQISKSQTLHVNSQLNDLAPSYLKGELREPLYITPEQETLPKLFPSGLPALRLPRCRLDLSVTSTIGYAGRLNLHIVGTDKYGDSARIDQCIYLAPGSPMFPNTSVATIPLQHVLTIGPQRLDLTYDIGISGYGSVEAGAFACGRVAISTPLRLAFCADTIDLGGKVVEIDQGLRDDIARYLVAGEIQADVVNHFPLGMHACVVLRPDSGEDQRATDTLAIPVGIPSGTVDASRTCQKSADTTVVGNVDEQSLVIFHSHRIRAQLRLYMPATDTVQIRDQDFLKFSARAVLKLRVGGNNE